MHTQESYYINIMTFKFLIKLCLYKINRRIKFSTVHTSIIDAAILEQPLLFLIRSRVSMAKTRGESGMPRV